MTAQDDALGHHPLTDACESARCPCGHIALDHAWHGCEDCDCTRSGIHAVLASGAVHVAPDAPTAEPAGDVEALAFTSEQIDRLGHWLSECLDDAAPLFERVWRSRAEWMVKGPTFQSVLGDLMAAERAKAKAEGVNAGIRLAADLVRDHVLGDTGQRVADFLIARADRADLLADAPREAQDGGGER